MAAYDLEEQEQLSAIKAWWEQNGNRVTWVLLVIAVLAAGWTGWNMYQRSQTEKAGALYAAVTQAGQAKDVTKLRALTQEVVSKYGSLTVAQLSALTLGKAEFDAGNAKAAQTQFEWAATKGSDPLLRDFARLRLAAVQLDEKDTTGALKTLETAPAAALNARFEDLRGDILFAKGDADAARDAYKKAMTALGEGGQDTASFRYVVQTKLDALGGA